MAGKKTQICPHHPYIYIFFLFFFRQSSTQCTNTSQDFIWCVLVIFCNYHTQPSELMYSLRQCLLQWQPIKMRRLLSSKLITIHLQRDSGILEPESHKKSKLHYGSVALLSHNTLKWSAFLGLSFFVRCWWPRESMLQGSLHFHTLKVQILKVLTLCQSVKVKQRYLCYLWANK